MFHTNVLPTQLPSLLLLAYGGSWLNYRKDNGATPGHKGWFPSKVHLLCQPQRNYSVSYAYGKGSKCRPTEVVAPPLLVGMQWT